MNQFLSFLGLTKEETCSSEKYKKNKLPAEQEMLLKNRILSAMNSGLFRANDLDLQKLAETVGSDKHKVSMIINKHFGVNFNKWLAQYRIEEAKKMLLTEPGVTIKTIIFESGFNSSSTFYDVFKRHTNLTPNEFKRFLN